jgi:hypothetical protein
MKKGGYDGPPSPGFPDGAQTAIEALAWLAAEPTRLEGFIAASGLGPQNLRQAAAEPRFLAAVLDYLASDEALLIAFARDSARRPEDVARAHARLAGPQSEASP